jgi:hypothetical protein
MLLELMLLKNKLLKEELKLQLTLPQLNKSQHKQL